MDEEKLKIYGIHAEQAMESQGGRYIARGGIFNNLREFLLKGVTF